MTYLSENAAFFASLLQRVFWNKNIKNIKIMLKHQSGSNSDTLYTKLFQNILLFDKKLI